jgi:hypothetical protein
VVSSIERVNYYEQQYLRSFDFTAEQNYHLEMRRRLNLALHLIGLVGGLELSKGPLEPSLPDQVYVTPGLAIDGYGREIVRVAAFAIDEDVVADNKISAAGDYDVYVAYQRELGTPPDAGYRVCDLKDQYTRWTESGRIFLSNETQPQPAVALTDALPDDPDSAPWPVKLGTVTVGLDATGTALIATAVKDAKPGDRSYVGIRAQRLVAPVAALTAGGPNKQDTMLPIWSEADFRATKNLIVGTDFTVDKTKVKPAPTDPNFPGDAGNVRIEKNLFLKGELYKSQGDQWLGLSELFRQMIPEIKVANGISIDTTALQADPPNNTVPIDAALLTSKVLTKPSSATVFVALAGLEVQPKNTMLDWWNKLTGAAGTTAIDLGITVGALAKKAGTDNVFEGSLSWSVGPKSITADPNNAKIAVTKLTVNMLVVFSP